jgi:hypothetical protein
MANPGKIGGQGHGSHLAGGGEDTAQGRFPGFFHGFLL